MIEKNLLRESMRDKLHLAGTVVCGLFGGVSAGIQAYLLAFMVAAAFRGGLNLKDIRGQLILFLAIIILRGAFNWLEERFALSLGKKVQQSLRRQLMEKFSILGPVRLRGTKYGELLTLLTEGLDSLEIYFQKYLPQLFKSAILPLTFLIIVFPLDWQTGLIMCLTAPLVPVFMSLIGQWTKGQTLRQWQVLSRMGGYFQDVFEGLATLKLFNRNAGQREKIEEVSEDFRASSLQVLKWGFLSSFVLEILTTISIAMIAVGLGLRLVYGMLDFRIALFLLFLAPEFYLPLRSLGAQYHNSLNGAAAAKSIYSLLAPTDSDLNSEPKTQNSKPGQENCSENTDLVFDNVCFSYEAERTALSNVSFSLKAGEKLGLIGPSGSGKTTLLNLLAGFIQPDAGSISLGGQILGAQDPDTLRRQLAFVPQNPYLFKGTIMANIRLGNPAADAEAVISLCRELGAHDLFIALPQGYNTPVGQGGCALSGGERQMLAIARACLKDAPLIMLDEATRNLDWQHDYLLQQALDRLTRGKTVIAITHRLQTIAKMDKLLVLAEGRVAQFGPPYELMRPSAARIQNSVFRIQNAGSIRFAKTIKQKPCFSLKPLRRKLLMDQPGALSSLLGDRVTSTPQPAKPALPPFKGGAREWHLVTYEHEAAMKNENPNSTLHSPLSTLKTPNSTLNTQHSTLGRRSLSIGLRNSPMLKLCRPYMAQITGSCLLSASAIIANIALLGFSAYLISRASLAPPLLDLMMVIVAVRFFGISRAALRYLERYKSHDVTFRILKGLRLWYYDQMEKLSYISLKKLGMGRIFKHIIGDVEILKFFYLRVLTVPLLTLIIWVTVSLFLGFFSWKLILILTAFFSCGGILSPYLLRRFLAAKRGDYHSRKLEYNESLYDYINGLTDQEIYGDRPKRMEQIESSGRALDREHQYIGLWDSFAAVSTSFWANLALLLALVVMIPQLAKANISGLLLASVAWVIWAAFEALQPMAAATEYLNQSRSALAGMSEAAARPREPEREGKAAPPSLAGLTVEDLSFGYEQDQPVLSDITFTLEPGAKTALLGSSGAGKSTLLNLLIGFLPYDKGRITSSGIELKQISAADLRRQIGYLDQHPYFFHASIRENILIAKENANEEEMKVAIEKARLAEFIDSLPEGYDTIVGENGYKLSAGQRQRLALARLFLQDAPLIMLDEATGSLDRENRDSLFETLSRWWADKTVLYITHECHGLAAMDNILIMEQGRIVEQGSEAELLQAGGYYARVYAIEHSYF